MILAVEGSKQLELLMTYTVFHLGLYSTIFGVCVVYYEKKKPDDRPTTLLGFIWFFLACAGAAGGTIAANIPEHPTWHEFTKDGLKFIWGIPGPAYPIVAAIEHSCFWVAIVLVGIFVVVVSKLENRT